MMRPIVINGDVWRVVRVDSGNPHLVDRTGHERLATTDSESMTIYVLSTVKPPLLDKVMVHEVSHAVTVSYGLLDSLRSMIPPSLWVRVEEWAAQLVENHGLEAYDKASDALGRPVCVEGACFDRPRQDRPRDTRLGGQR